MNDLRDFVLDFCRANGALVDSPGYGVSEVLLPDALAAQLGVGALQEIVFDDLEPGVEDGRLHLAQGHPLIDRMVELARRAPAPAEAHINAVRLDKRGLAQVARQALSFANARLVELPKQIEAPALCHYLVLTFKVTLTTDEKQEQLVTVAMDAQAGWPAEWDSIRQHATLEQEAAFGHLEPARPRWIEEPHPLTPAALAGLSERAKRAVLAKLSGPIESLGRRAARYLELDRARLEQYYDDLVRDLERRLRQADGDRQATLKDKIAAAQAERRLKLDDAEARYRLRADLELITAQVVTQPKLELLVQIENRSTQIKRRVVWDPLLHCIEPLACDVCGQPGQSLQLCAGGHLAHTECLLEQQCVDCKRVYCRLCQEEMAACAVCGRPVCRTSLNRCGICKRGTCHEHVGLCHAADGAPADLQPSEEPAVAPPQKVAAPVPAPTRKEAKEPAKTRPRPKRPAKAPVRQAAPRRNSANWKIAVETEWGEPVVAAFVLASKKRQEAVRCWHLTPRGISVACDCEKADCASNAILLRPATAQAIEAQMQAQIEELRREYGVPARNVSYTLFINDMPSAEPRLTLRGPWKDEEVLAEARSGFDVIYAQQHEAPAPPHAKRRATASRPLRPDEAAKAKCFLTAAFGLLKLEGTLKQEELYTRVRDLVHPGAWCTCEYASSVLRQNRAYFKVLASGLVATHDVSNVQALATRKRACRLEPREWSLEELLAVADESQPLPEREARIEEELSELTGIDISVRMIQCELQYDTSPATFVASLEHHYGVSDPEALHRAADLIEELSAHTPRWELNGWTPAQAAAVEDSTPSRHGV